MRGYIMKNLKTFIFITILIVVVIIVIIINIMSNLGVTINKSKNDKVSSNVQANNIEDTSTTKVVEEENIKTLVKSHAEEYMNLLNAYYGEENDYSKRYSKEQIKKILYDKTAKQEDDNIDNFIDNLKIKEKAEYYFEEIVYSEIEKENLMEYYITFGAGFQQYDGLAYFTIEIYVDKTTNAFLIYFVDEELDSKNSVAPVVNNIEKNSNNEFEK